MKVETKIFLIFLPKNSENLQLDQYLQSELEMIDSLDMNLSKNREILFKNDLDWFLKELVRIRKHYMNI